MYMLYISNSFKMLDISEMMQFIHSLTYQSDHGVAGSNPAEGEILPEPNDASLYSSFHVHPSIVSK